MQQKLPKVGVNQLMLVDAEPCIENGKRARSENVNQRHNVPTVTQVAKHMRVGRDAAKTATGRS